MFFKHTYIKSNDMHISLNAGLEWPYLPFSVKLYSLGLRGTANGYINVTSYYSTLEEANAAYHRLGGS